MSNISEVVHYSVLFDDLVKSLGTDIVDVINLLEHGHSKRAIAKILKKPYPAIKEIINNIKAQLIKLGEAPITRKKKARRNNAKK